MTDKPRMLPPSLQASASRSLTIDSIAFAKAGKRQDGNDDTASMFRLHDVLADQPASLDWSVAGNQTVDANGTGKQWLQLRGQLKAAMPCARCLGAVPVNVALDRRFLMAQDETIAAKLDGESDDYDVLVASRHFALADLLEDEALMALPNFVVHADCQPVAIDDDKLESPFAALAQWRDKKS